MASSIKIRFEMAKLREACIAALKHLRVELLEEWSPAERALESPPKPKSLEWLLSKAEELTLLVQSQGREAKPVTFIDDEGPVLRLALERWVLLKWKRLEMQKQRTDNQELLGALRREIRSIRNLLETGPLQTISPFPMPGLEDYVNPATAQKLLADQGIKLAPRLFDEKFHILQSPNLFLSDLHFYRRQCKIRRRPLAVAFVDIDHLKSLNEALTESVVDRDILSPFMRRIEASVFGRGFAYRQGGDEYLVLLPNTDRQEAVHFFSHLRRQIKNLDIPGEQTFTVSIGLFVVPPNAYLTDRQVRERVNLAKHEAKTTGGRDCVALADYDAIVIADRDPVPEEEAE